MMRGLTLYAAGVGTGVLFCGAAARLFVPMVVKEVTEIAGRALSPEDFDRLTEELKFKVIELENDEKADTVSRKAGRRIGVLLFPPKKEHV